MVLPCPTVPVYAGLETKTPFEVIDGGTLPPNPAVPVNAGLETKTPFEVIDAGTPPPTTVEPGYAGFETRIPFEVIDCGIDPPASTPTTELEPEDPPPRPTEILKLAAGRPLVGTTTPPGRVTYPADPVELSARACDSDSTKSVAEVAGGVPTGKPPCEIVGVIPGVKTPTPPD